MGMGGRHYWQESGGGSGGSAMGLPRPSLVVKWLLIINGIVFLIQLFADQHRGISDLFGVTVNSWWQIWRYITFQFLHGGAWHIILNMLGVYILGTPLEQKFGSKRFLTFYLTCGAFAGLAYVIIGSLGSPHYWDTPIIGASGGVFAILLACAIYFPQMQIIFLFFPVPIRLASIIIFGVMLLTVGQAAAAKGIEAAMSDVAHLGGAVAAAVWIWILPRVMESVQFSRRERRQGAWDRHMERRRGEQAKIDRILQKIHDQGISSLTDKERRTLQEATRRQEEEDQHFRRMG